MNGNSHPELNYLFWKDEILQVMYWMYGEGIAAKVSALQFEGLLNASYSDLEPHFEKLCRDGLLEKDESGGMPCFSLTQEGRKEAGRHFATAFEGLQQAGHGECGPDCEFCYGDNGEKLENCVHNCASSHTHPHYHD
jgi:hypothetical protein